MIFGNRYLHELSINGTQVTDDKGFADEEENQNNDQQQNQTDDNTDTGENTPDTGEDPTVNNDEPDEFEQASAAGDTGEENPEPDNTDEPATQDDGGDTGTEDTPEDPTATDDEPDEFDLANGEDNPDDGGGEGDNPDNGGDNGEGDNAGGEGGDDPTANNDEPDEFEQASAAGDGGGDAGGDNPDGGDGEGDNPDYGGDTGDEGGTDGINSEMDNLEKQLFGNLTDEQLKVKSLELKSNYKRLYTVCDDIITKVGEIPKTAESAEIIKRIINIASDLKEYIESYMLYNFGNNSLPENMIMFKKYLVILNGIKKCLAELEKNTVDINNKNKLNESMMFLEGLKLISV